MCFELLLSRLLKMGHTHTQHSSLFFLLCRHFDFDVFFSLWMSIVRYITNCGRCGGGGSSGFYFLFFGSICCHIAKNEQNRNTDGKKESIHISIIVCYHSGTTTRTLYYMNCTNNMFESLFY